MIKKGTKTALKHSRKIHDNISDLNTQIHTRPDDPVLYYRRGVEWSHRGVFDLALADFSRAIDLKDDYARAYFSRATVYNVLKEFDKAKDDFYRSRSLLKNLRSREDEIRRN